MLLCHRRPILGKCSLNRSLHDTRNWVFCDGADRQKNRRTWRLYDLIGPEGQFSKKKIALYALYPIIAPTPAQQPPFITPNPTLTFTYIQISSEEQKLTNKKKFVLPNIYLCLENILITWKQIEQLLCKLFLRGPTNSLLSLSRVWFKLEVYFKTLIKVSRL